jgi:Zn-dependent alcohol dehydrogenase
MSIKASKRLLGLGFAASLSLSSGIAAAAGNIAVLVNDTKVQSGEEIGIKVVMNGDGLYDAYMWIEGGVLGGAKLAIDETGQFAPWNDQAPPKLRNSIDLAALTVKDKIVNVLPKVPATGLTGTYNLTAALAAPGTLDFNPTDNVQVIIE